MSDQNPSATPPAQPAQPYGAVPGGPETVGQAPPPPAEAPKKKSPFGRIAIYIVVALIVAGVGWFLSKDDAAKANVGDCLAGTTTAALNADDLKIADCTSADAGFKVVQRVDDKLYEDAQGACTDPAGEYVFWSGKDGQKGTVLCLATVTK